MNGKEYVENVLKTENLDYDLILSRIDVRTIRLLHAAMGLVTEAGEFMDALKKWMIYGKPLDRTNLIEELGDGDWYEGLAIDELETSFEQIWERNIAKLKERYKGKFNETGALDRDLDKEREILEGETHYSLGTGYEDSVAICGSKTGRVTLIFTAVTCTNCKKMARVNYTNEAFGTSEKAGEGIHPEKLAGSALEEILDETTKDILASLKEQQRKTK